MAEWEEIVRRVRYDYVNWTWRALEMIFKRLEELEHAKNLLQSREQIESIVRDLCGAAIKTAGETANKLEQLTKRVDSLEATLKKIKNDLTVCLSKLSRVDKALANASDNITQLFSRVQKLESSVKTLADADVEIGNKIRKIRDDITNIRKQIKRILELIAGVQGES